MLLSNVQAPRPRLPLTETDLRDAIRLARVSDAILHGVTPDGFHLEVRYHPVDGLPVTAVLVNRSGAVKTIKCPDRALEYVRALAIEEFEVDVSRWDPQQAFDPARESFLSRRRRQSFEAAVDRLQTRLGEPYAVCSAASAQQRLQALARQLAEAAVDESDLRALTLCWCDVYLRRFPMPARATKALYRYANSSGIVAQDLLPQLTEYCADEFKRRCKNQYLASLDLGGEE